MYGLAILTFGLIMVVFGIWLIKSRCPNCFKKMAWTSVGMLGPDEERWVCFHCDYEGECRLGNVCVLPVMQWRAWRKGHYYILRPKSGGNIREPDGWEKVMFDPFEFEAAKKKALGLK